MKTIWDDEEPFRDGAPVLEGGQWKEQETYSPVPDTVIRARQIQQQQAQQAQEELDVESLTEEVAQDDDDEDYTDVLSDARLRLEQGKLWEMLLEHDLFKDVDADPRAAKSVQKYVRKFARERMEIMLGIRSEAEVNPSVVSSPFNDLEVTILKKLASAASKGATETEEANTQVDQIISQPKKKTLNTIGSSKPRQQAKPIQKRVDPIQRKSAPKREASSNEPDYGDLNKPIHEMTAVELAERDRLSLERQKRLKSAPPSDKIPMPDYSTMEQLALSQVNRAVGSPTKNNLSALIMANLKNGGKV